MLPIKKIVNNGPENAQKVAQKLPQKLSKVAPKTLQITKTSLLNRLPADVAAAGGVQLDAAVDGDVVLRVETGVAAVVVVGGDERGAVLVVVFRGG